jgi:hypothetical protein
MDSALLGKTLLLLVLANGAPVIISLLLGRRLARPIDGGMEFVDARPWLGSSKTFRGVIASILATTVGAVPLGYPATVGASFAAASMAGDLISSFIKRRLGLSPGRSAVCLDQIPESLLPLLICWNALELTPDTAMLVLAVFLIMDLVVTKLVSLLPFSSRSQ